MLQGWKKKSNLFVKPATGSLTFRLSASNPKLCRSLMIIGAAQAKRLEKSIENRLGYD
jgi:hypothetical protein